MSQNQVPQLDKEKAAYLFDPDEIALINDDLSTMFKDPYDGLTVDEATAMRFEKNQSKLDEWLYSLKDREELLLSEITINKKNIRDIRINEKGDFDKESKKRRKELENIVDRLKDQQGLSKLWTINEKLGIEEESNLSESSAFEKAVKDPTEPEDSLFKKLRNYDPTKKVTVADTCPLCKGNRFFKFLFLKFNCFKCKGSGSVQIDLQEYYRKWELEHQYTPCKRKLIFQDIHKVIEF